MMQQSSTFEQAAAAPTDRDDAWAAAMRGFELARETEVAYDNDHWRPAYDTAKQGGQGIPERVDVEMERLIDLRCDAEEALIATPAPHVQAVTWKIVYARERWAEFTDWPDDWWAAVMVDLYRLGGTAADAFDPSAWLEQFEAVGGGFIVKPEGVEVCFLLHGHPPCSPAPGKAPLRHHRC